MRLYLIRHGKVEAPDSIRYSDGDRPLSDAGAAEIAQLADWMSDCGIAPQLILHSPLLRTTQTAQIIGEKLGVAPQPWPMLADDIENGRWSAALSERFGNHSSVALVGHQPGLLSLLAELLNATPFSFELSRGAFAEVAVETITPKLRGTLVTVRQPNIGRQPNTAR